MTDVPPDVTTSFSGHLPLSETASADRIGRVVSGDLPTASPLDVSGMVLVTSCVTARFGMADLAAEAAGVGLIRPVRVAFRLPYADLDGTHVRDAALLTAEELAVFQRFVDGSVFKFGDGTMRAFLHAVVVAVPGESTVGVPEAVWTAARTGWLADRLPDGSERLDLPFSPLPPAVVLWTVGLEATDRRGVRLRSGFVAALDRSAT